MSRTHTGCIDHSLLRIYLTSPQKPVRLLNHLSNPAIVSCILESFRNIPGNLTISGRCLCWEQDVSWSHGSLGCMQPDAIFHQMTYGTQKGWSWAIRSCLFGSWILNDLKVTHITSTFWNSGSREGRRMLEAQPWPGLLTLHQNTSVHLSRCSERHVQEATSYAATL